MQQWLIWSGVFFTWFNSWKFIRRWWSWIGVLLLPVGRNRLTDRPRCTATCHQKPEIIIKLCFKKKKEEKRRITSGPDRNLLAIDTDMRMSRKQNFGVQLCELQKRARFDGAVGYKRRGENKQQQKLLTHCGCGKQSTHPRWPCQRGQSSTPLIKSISLSLRIRKTVTQ